MYYQTERSYENKNNNIHKRYLPQWKIYNYNDQTIFKYIFFFFIYKWYYSFLIYFEIIDFVISKKGKKCMF